jgi:hypothetical protein
MKCKYFVTRSFGDRKSILADAASNGEEHFGRFS